MNVALFSKIFPLYISVDRISISSMLDTPELSPWLNLAAG
nr:MAG TPA: hypothetical protein [Caudoviricetes sp.]DAT20473.1 MAG TPA: hypothetical protein [Caudoviricetes sp.]DAY50600.1 MAG TPA: hypothetical protein [Caudoviricetes sp.]